MTDTKRHMSRLPIIRHIRWWIWKRRVDAHYALWKHLGSHDGNRVSDDAHLQDIWDGKA